MEKVRSTLDPVVDFEALLSPDPWQRVGLAAPALAVEAIITNACDARDIEKIKKATGRQELKTGCDSAAILRHIAGTSAPRTREAMTLQLASLRNLEGATGTTSFDDHREAVKELFSLTIDKNGVKELDAKGRGGT